MSHETKNGATREAVCEYVEKKYGMGSECPWVPLPPYLVARRPDNKKWYAIIMNVSQNKLGMGDKVDILDIKCNPIMRDMLLREKGFLPAHHINSKNWIGVLLDGSADKDTVFRLLDESYIIASGKTKRATRNAPTSWLVPANPKYYDLEKAFMESDTILWKQSNAVIVGDTIYIYMAAPFYCILYKCKAIDVDIPYQYDDGNLSMKKVMRLQRLYTFDRNDFGRVELREHEILSVRGPRRVPYALRCKLEQYN